MKPKHIALVIAILLLFVGCSSQSNSSSRTSMTTLASFPPSASNDIRAAIKKMNSVTSLRMRTVSPSGAFVDTFTYEAPDRYKMVSADGVNQDWIDIGTDHYDLYGNCWRPSKFTSDFLHYKNMIAGLAQLEATRREGNLYFGRSPKEKAEVRISISDGYITQVDAPLPHSDRLFTLVFDMFGNSARVEPPPSNQVGDFCDFGTEGSAPLTRQ